MTDSESALRCTTAIDPLLPFDAAKAILQQLLESGFPTAAITALIVEVGSRRTWKPCAPEREACAYETSSVVRPSRRAKDRAVLSQ